MDMMAEICDQMMMNSSAEMEHSDNHMEMINDNNLPVASDCDMTADCNYSYNYTIQETIIPSVFLKTKTVPALTSIFGTQQVAQKTYQSNFQPTFKKSYSPPLLFLVNESFLI